MASNSTCRHVHPYRPGLMNLTPSSTPSVPNETNWREARMWLREMAGMRPRRIESVVDDMTLFDFVLPTRLKTEICARAKLPIETAARAHLRIQDVRWTEEFFLHSDPRQRAQIIRPGDTGEALSGRMMYKKQKKLLHAGNIRVYDAQMDKYSILFQNGRMAK